MKVYNTHDQSSCLLRFFFYFRPSVHLSQSNQRFQANRIRGLTRSGKALNLIFPKHSLQNMRGFSHTKILIPSFQNRRHEYLGPQPSFCVRVVLFSLY